MSTTTRTASSGAHGLRQEAGTVGLVAVAATAAATGILALGLAEVTTRTLGTGDLTAPGVVLLALAAGLGALCAGWLSTSALLVLLGALPGAAGRWASALSARITPALLRRVAAMTLGASSAAVVLPGTAVAAPAVTRAATTSSDAPSPDRGDRADPPPAPTWPTHAPDPSWSGEAPGPSWSVEAPAPPGSVEAPAPTGSARTPTHVPRPTSPQVAPPSPSWSVTTTAPAPGWTPARPRPTHQPGLDVLGGRRPSGSPDPGEGHVVLRGDCLWDVVARRLGPTATDADVAAAVPAWHTANRDVIGDDPDLIVPGTVLVPPPHSPLP